MASPAAPIASSPREIRVFISSTFRDMQDEREELVNPNVLYLFWFARAKASPWVEKECKCALSTRGEEFIDPVPLVSPEEVRPPEELSKKHFNDWILAFRRGRPKAD